MTNLFFIIAAMGFFYTGLKMLLTFITDAVGGIKEVIKHFTKKTFKFSKEQMELIKIFVNNFDHDGMWDYITHTAGIDREQEASLNRKTGVLIYWGKKGCPEAEKVETKVAEENKKS